MREFAARARTADHRHRRRHRATAASNSDPQPPMYIPQAQVPDAANALNVSLTPIAWIVRTQGEPQPLSAAIQDQLRQSTGLPVTDVRIDGRSRVALDLAAAVQHVADDGVRRRRRCCWRRSASTD